MSVSWRLKAESSSFSFLYGDAVSFGAVASSRNSTARHLPTTHNPADTTGEGRPAAALQGNR
jgi:hypothetical protein